MADIELVIKIPKEDYERCKKRFQMRINIMGDAIANGTPLPKGHGRLIDADVMINKLCTHEANELFGSITCAEILDFINDEKPIIGADREVEE